LGQWKEDRPTGHCTFVIKRQRYCGERCSHRKIQEGEASSHKYNLL
jgi:hypothetical protein